MQKTCLVCGDIFSKKPSESRKYWETKKYCSSKCSLEKTSVRKQANVYSIPKGSVPWNSGMKYDLKMKSRLNVSGLERGRGMFRGVKRPEFSGANHPRFTQPIVIACEYCGKDIERKAWQLKKHSYCNLLCSRAGIRGKDSPVFKGDAAKSRLRQRIMQLPEYSAWRKAIFLRDGFTCVQCGSYKALEADHIKSYAEIIKENHILTTEDALKCDVLWDVTNGRTLCLECHRRTDTYPKNLLSHKP